MNYIKDVQVNKEVTIEGHILVTEKFSEASKKNFLVLNLQDSLGDALFINMFNSSPFYKKFSNTEYLYGEITFKTSDGSNGFINHNVTSFVEKEKPINSPFKLDMLKKRLKEHINSIDNKDLRNIALEVFKDKKILNNMFIVPANVESAYTYDGALLVHTVRMMDIADSMYDVLTKFDSYKSEGEKELSINVEMLKIAILLHDLGKIDAFDKKLFKIEKTIDGVLFDDAYLSIRTAERFVEGSTLNLEQKRLLLHVIGAAKGSTSFGAVHTPRTLEAYLLSFIDKLDYHISLFEGLKRDIKDADIEIVKNQQKQYVLTSFNDVTPVVEDEPEDETSTEGEPSDEGEQPTEDESLNQESTESDIPDENHEENIVIVSEDDAGPTLTEDDGIIPGINFEDIKGDLEPDENIQKEIVGLDEEVSSIVKDVEGEGEVEKKDSDIDEESSEEKKVEETVEQTVLSKETELDNRFKD